MTGSGFVEGNIRACFFNGIRRSLIRYRLLNSVGVIFQIFECSKYFQLFIFEILDYNMERLMAERRQSNLFEY